MKDEITMGSESPRKKRVSFLGKKGYFGYRTRVELVREGEVGNFRNQ